MSTLSIPGLGSNLDVNTIINSLVAVERKPIELMQTEAATLKTQVSSFGKLQSYLSGLRDAAAKLTSTDLWKAAAATSSNATAVGVSASGSAAAGSYSISVSSLAASQSVAAAAVPAGSTIGQGSLTIELGAWDANNNFAPKSGASAVTVTIGPGEDTLEAIRDKINAANAGVTAAIVTDANGARLTMRSASTGAENGFRIGVTDSDGNNADASGLSRLAYNAAGGSQMTRTQTAANATAKVNGLDIVSTSNHLDGAVPGVGIDLNQIVPDTAPVNINVSADNSAVTKAVQGFVQAYNDLNSFISSETKYDDSTKVAGTLQGDRTALGLQSMLRSMLGNGSTASATFQRLSDVGLEVQRGGAIQLNQTKLTAALNNRSELQKMFGAVDTNSTSSSANGFAVLFRNSIDGYLGTDGALTSRTDSLNRRIKNNESDQAKAEDRVALYQKRLEAQYTALDTQMAQLNSLSSYVTQHFSSSSS